MTYDEIFVNRKGIRVQGKTWVAKGALCVSIGGKYCRILHRDQSDQINISREKLSKSCKYVIILIKIAEGNSLSYKLNLLP